MKKLNLNGNWRGICYKENGDTDFTFNGTVPGCVHTDFSSEGIIDYDIMYRDNLEKCQWIENRSFDYIKTFTVSDFKGNAELVFEGLDTYTDIYLNDKLLSSTDNMFIDYRFDVKDMLIKGENTLKVHFRSPIKEVEGKPELPAAFTCERLHSRRIQCTYGWDWVGRFVTSGIYKDVYIEFENDLTVDNVYIHTVSIFGNTPQICFEAEFKNYENGDLVDLEIISPENEVVYSHKYYVKEKELKDYIDLPDAKLWYPAGYGDQPIYTLKLCGKEFKFGIRTARVARIIDKKDSEYYKKSLELKQSEFTKPFDENEEFFGFQLFVNDIPVFCKGGNWVPSEPFPSAETDEKITEILTLAKKANLNMLRIWGGGIFEKDHFYDECDRLGIMTSQDFLMACGKYPDDEPYFISQLQKESEYAAKKLRNHPCLMWWSGDNENATYGADDIAEFNGRTAIHEGLTPNLLRFDPQRRLMPSSPCGGKKYMSRTAGTTHNTNFLGEVYYPFINKTDMLNYKEVFELLTARFIAEEPVLGASSLPSLRKFMTDDDIFNDDKMWLYHTKDLGTPEVPNYYLLQNFAKHVLGEFENNNDRFFKTKYAQYEWVRITMETNRRNKGYCNGEIYWMWNDCWPAASGWAFVDYYCQPKASFYSFKRVAAPLLVSLNKKDNQIQVYLINDTRNDINGELDLYLISNGNHKKIQTINVTSPAEISSVVCNLDADIVANGELVYAKFTVNSTEYCGYYRNGTLPLTSTNGAKIIERTENSITVTADSYVHVVEFEGEFVFDDNYFSLLPGETRTINFEKARINSSDEIIFNAYTIKF